MSLLVNQDDPFSVIDYIARLNTKNGPAQKENLEIVLRVMEYLNHKDNAVLEEQDLELQRVCIGKLNGSDLGLPPRSRVHQTK